MDSIQIGDVTIHEDVHGRYSLNDLHRAAGGETRHQPAQFLRLLTTQELIATLAGERYGDSHIAPVEAIRGGPTQGTYACRELVYAYAMWVSPVFHLRVIRVFDAVARAAQAPAPIQSEAPAFPIPKTYAEALRLAADLVEQVEKQQAHLEAQAAQLTAQAPAVKLATDYLSAEGDRCLTDAATALAIPPRTFTEALVEHGICYRRKGLDGERKPRLLPHAEYVTRGYLVNRARLVTVQTKEGPKEKDFSQTMVTPAGMAYLFKRLGHLSTRTPSQALLPDSAGGQP